MEKLLNLLNFALAEKKLTCKTVGFESANSLTSDNLQRMRTLEFEFTDNKEAIILNVKDSNSKKILDQKIREALPITTIIDFIGFAIESKIIKDIEKDNSNAVNGKESEYSGVEDFIRYRLCEGCYDYTKITQHDKAFKFVRDIDGVSVVNRVAFNKDKCNIKKRVEYANRASNFIDSLLKQVMTTYNVLEVDNAQVNVENDRTKWPKIARDMFVTVVPEDTDATSEHSKTENQVSLLIHYRDNIGTMVEDKNGNKHVDTAIFSKSVIDRITITFDKKDKITTAKYSSADTVMGRESGNKRDVALDPKKVGTLINEISEIVEHYKNETSKRKILKWLSKNDSKLRELIESRMDAYNELSGSEKPKVEFTMSLLSIYINKIKRVPVNFEIKYDVSGKKHLEYLKDVKCVYNKIYDPERVDDYKVHPLKYNNKDYDVGLSSGEEIVCALLVNPLGKDPADIEAIAAPKSETVVLYDERDNPFYKKEELNGVRFPKYLTQPVKTKSGKTVTCLKEDVKQCFFTKNFYHKDEMISVKKECVISSEALPKDKNEIWILNDDKQNLHKCPICGEMFYASENDWKNECSKHKLVYVSGDYGLEPKHCCKKCANNEREQNGKKYFIFGGDEKLGKYYFIDDADELTKTSICPCCHEENKEEQFIYMDSKYYEKCDLCGQLCCTTHVDKIGNNNICHKCDKDKKVSKYLSFQIDPTGDVWKKIRHLLKSGKKDHFMYQLNGTELRVCEDGGSFRRLYFFVSDNERKVFFLKKVIKYNK